MRIVLAVLLLAHSISHLPGFLVSWQLRSFPEMPYRTRFSVEPWTSAVEASRRSAWHGWC
jgi:hypothetical protein